MEKDYLGTQLFCKSCDYVKNVGSALYCMNEDSEFYKLRVDSLLLTSCHSKYEKELSKKCPLCGVSVDVPGLCEDCMIEETQRAMDEGLIE